MTEFLESQFHAKRRRRQQGQLAARGMTDEQWRERRLAMGRERMARRRERLRALGLDPFNPTRVAEAPYPRGFALDHDAFAVAYRAFWEPRP